MLVITPEAFNRLTKTPIVVPITNGGNFARVARFTVNLEGLKTAGVVRCDQPRALDLVARNVRKLESVLGEIMDEVLAEENAIEFLFKQKSTVANGSLLARFVDRWGNGGILLKEHSTIRHYATC